jgi:hypothetical protein
MDRPEQQASAHDPSFYSGTEHINNFTLASFSHDEVVSKAAMLGVSLGRTKSQILDSVNLLKDIDLERTLITLKRKEEKDFASADDNSSFVIEEVNNLSKDLLEEEFSGIENHKDLSIQTKRPTWIQKKKAKEVKIPCRHRKILKDKV